MLIGKKHIPPIAFADIHCHVLWGLDDGAVDAEQMQKMLCAAYQSGTRLMCATPHYHPSRFSVDPPLYDARCAEAKAFAEEHCPGMRLLFGQELFADSALSGLLRQGACHTLGASRAVLVEFFPAVLYFTVEHILQELQSYGYQPVLAHAERYACLSAEPKRLQDLHNAGVLIQCNANALCGKCGPLPKKIVRYCLDRELVDFVASDTHDPVIRTPDLRDAYTAVVRRCGKSYAEQIFCSNANQLFCEEDSHG